jgi:hypothetical protein
MKSPKNINKPILVIRDMSGDFPSKGRYKYFCTKIPQIPIAIIPIRKESIKFEVAIYEKRPMYAPKAYAPALEISKILRILYTSVAPIAVKEYTLPTTMPLIICWSNIKFFFPFFAYGHLGNIKSVNDTT